MNEAVWGLSRVLAGLFNISIFSWMLHLVYLQNSYWMGLPEIAWLLCFFMLASFSAIILTGDGLIMLKRLREERSEER